MARSARATRIVRQLRGDQITIPAESRRRLGLVEDSVLEIALEAGELRIRPLAVTAQGSPWLKELYEQFATVREEAARYDEKEIDRTIDDAVSAVRRPPHA